MSRQPIEFTSKKWKLRRMLGLLLFCLGWWVTILNAAAMIGGQRPVPMILHVRVLLGLAMIGVGMLVYIHARLMARRHRG